MRSLLRWLQVEGNLQGASVPDTEPYSALQQNWLFQMTPERRQKIDTKTSRTERSLPSGPAEELKVVPRRVLWMCVRCECDVRRQRMSCEV